MCFLVNATNQCLNESMIDSPNDSCQNTECCVNNFFSKSPPIFSNLYYNFVLANNQKIHLDPSTCSQWQKNKQTEIWLLNQPLICVAFYEECMVFIKYSFIFMYSFSSWLIESLQYSNRDCSDWLTVLWAHFGLGEDNFRGVWTTNLNHSVIFYIQFFFFVFV